MLRLDKNEHLIVRLNKNNLDGSLNYEKPAYMVIKDLESLNDIKPLPNHSYYIENYTTTDKVTEYRSSLPTKSTKRFIMFELEQHQGMKLAGEISTELVNKLVKTHDELMPEGLKSKDALLSYKTGGGYNLIYFTSIEFIRKITRAGRRVRKEINNIIKENAFHEEHNKEGVYDVSYHLSVKGLKRLRLPLAGTVNPKYGNKFSGVVMQETAKEVNLNKMELQQTQQEKSMDDLIMQAYEETRDEINIDKEEKILAGTLDYLTSLGYDVGSDNTCIHPLHLDLKPSMYIGYDGKAVCKSGHSDHHRFSTADLVEAKGGDVTKIAQTDYVSNDLQLNGTFIENDTIRTVLRHIERNRVMVIGTNISDKATVYNYDNGRWSISAISSILWRAANNMAEICRNTLGKITNMGFDPVELKKSELYKLISKATIVRADNNHKTLMQTLILVIETEREIRNKALFSSLPSEKELSIPFLNGVYNAKTDKLEQETPKHRILSRVGVKYKKFSDYSEIENMLNDWTGGQGTELAIGLARALTRAESGKMLFLIGKGANGKSTLTTEILGAVLNNNKDSDDRASNISLINLADTSGNNFMLQSLAGKSCNISSEIERSHALLDTLKEKTGEGDVIQVNIKHKQPFEMKFNATLLLAGNTMPYVSETNRALVRRIQIFEFNNDYLKLNTTQQLREFRSRIRSNDFLELFFSYLANILNKYNQNLIAEQAESKVVELIKKYNDTIRTLIEYEYVVEAEAKASLVDFQAKLDILHGDIKQGSQWSRRVVVEKLKEKGFVTDIQNNIVGLRPKTSDDDNTPPKPKKEETMQRKEKGHKNKTSLFAKKQAEKAKEQNTTDIFTPSNLRHTMQLITPSTVAPQSVFDKVNSLLGDKLKGRIITALDIETTGLIPSEHKVATIQMLNSAGEEFIEVKKHSEMELSLLLDKRLNNQAVLGHNITFDMAFLKEHYDVDVVRDNIYVLDTMIAAKIDRQSTSVADELEQNLHMTIKDYKTTANGIIKDYSLKGLMKFYLNIEMDKTEQKSDWSQSLTAEQKEYAMEDVRHLHKLYEVITKSIQSKGMDLVLKLEENTTRAIIDANSHTLHINMEKGNKLADKFAKMSNIEVTKYNEIMKDVVAQLWENKEDMYNAYLDHKHAEKMKTFKAKTDKELMLKAELNFKKIESKIAEMQESTLNDKEAKKLVSLEKSIANKDIFLAKELAKLQKAEAKKTERKKLTDAKLAKDLAALTDKDGIFISKSKGIFKYIMSTLLDIEIDSTDKKAITKLLDKHIIFKQIEAMTAMLKEKMDIENALRYRTGEGRVITRLNQIGAVTGRMSSSALKDNSGKKAGINMQQINRDADFRDIFEATEGKKLILADYSGMELRIVAKVAKETKMIEAFSKNEDLHSKTAALLHDIDYTEFMEVLSNSEHKLYKEYKAYRNAAKSVGFLTVYGGGAKALSENSGISTEEAKELINNYKTVAFPKLAEYIEQQNNTKTVFTALGRRIDTEDVITSAKYFGMANSEFSWKQHNYEQRIAGLYSAAGYTTPVNFPIQGTGADIVKLAMSLLIDHEDYIADDVHIAHVVHDEIILEVSEAVAKKWTTILQDVMELAGNTIMDNKVYMEAEAAIGNSWNEAK